MSELESPFKVGAKVIICHNGRMRAKRTITKVYKSGNFLIAEGGTQQYRPWYSGFGSSWHATPTGEHNYTYASIIPMTPENELKWDVQRAQNMRESRLRSLQDWLHSKRDLTETQLELIEQAKDLEGAQAHTGEAS